MDNDNDALANIPEIWIDGIYRIESDEGGMLRVWLYANLPTDGDGEPARQVRILLRGSIYRLPGVVKELTAAVLLTPTDYIGAPVGSG